MYLKLRISCLDFIHMVFMFQVAEFYYIHPHLVYHLLYESDEDQLLGAKPSR